MIPIPDPNLDLTTSRIIKAPRRLVWSAWTDPENLAQWWIPAPARCRVARFMTAVITFTDHPLGTEYAAYVMHKSSADRRKHEELGFHEGWPTVAAQLAALVEARAAKEVIQ
jgi:uncharacterized protein YndB with AHSA1/START domain